jgi:3-dehydroquinate dehydratase
MRVIELDISNVRACEPLRHRSCLSPLAQGHMAELDVNGYALAIAALAM